MVGIRLIFGSLRDFETGDKVLSIVLGSTLPPRSTPRWASGSACWCATRWARSSASLIYGFILEDLIGLIPGVRDVLPKYGLGGVSNSLAGVGDAISGEDCSASPWPACCSRSTSRSSGPSACSSCAGGTSRRDHAASRDRSGRRHARRRSRSRSTSPRSASPTTRSRTCGGVGRAGVRSRPRQRSRRGRAGRGHRLRPLPLRRPGGGGRPAAPRRRRGHGAARLGRAARPPNAVRPGCARPSATARRRPARWWRRAASASPAATTGSSAAWRTWRASRTSAASPPKTRCSGSTTPPSAVSRTTCTATRRPGPSAASTPTTWTRRPPAWPRAEGSRSSAGSKTTSRTSSCWRCTPTTVARVSAARC